MINWNEIEPRIVYILNDVFKDKNFLEFSIYERRKMIYEYLCNTLEFDEEAFHAPSKTIDENIKEVLYKNKGICNSISYVYKVLLEKAKVYSLILFCMDENDKHTITLVDNGNGTLSFDDLSIGVYSKKIKGPGISIEERFDYEIENAKNMRQGLIKIDENNFYSILPSDAVNYFLGKEDEDYKKIMPTYMNENMSFSELAIYIESYKKNNTKTI